MIGVERDEALWTITLDRPDKANALTAQMLEALCEAVEAARAAPIRALILTGAGKVFSAGADLEAARAGLATSPLWERLSGSIAALPAVTVAALNGPVAGGACGMALACDLRIAVPETKVFYPVMRLGFLPQPSDPERLAALCGPSRAALVLLSGAKIGADEALAWGLVDRLVKADALMDTARALTADACAAKPDHVAAIKALLRRPAA